ncbi:hypothetical protein PMIN07_008611 [Paraphaeosphaeria minitans]
MLLIPSCSHEQLQSPASRNTANIHLQWGTFSAVAGGVAYAFSPIYRGLTVPFKVYIQMSGMILGSMIEADKRMIAYEHHVRHQKRLRRDMEVWRRYEEDLEARGTPGVGAESNVKGKAGDV